MMRSGLTAGQTGVRSLLPRPDVKLGTVPENGDSSRFSAEKFEEACRRTLEAATCNEEKQSPVDHDLALPNWPELDAMLKRTSGGAEQFVQVSKEQVKEDGHGVSNSSLDIKKKLLDAESKNAQVCRDLPTEAMVCTGEMPMLPDQPQSSLLHLWWGLVQDQVNTLTREIDSLRQANSQIQVRQAEALMQRSDEQTARMNESMLQIAQMAQEHSSLKMALETEREERLAANSRIWEVLQAEPERCEEQQRQISKLRDGLDGESAARQEVSAAVSEANLALEQEHQTRLKACSQLAESIQQLRAGVEKDLDTSYKEIQRISSVVDALQTHYEAIRVETARLQEEMVKRHRDLEERVVQSLSEQHEQQLIDLQSQEEGLRQVKEDAEKATVGVAEFFSHRESQLQINSDMMESMQAVRKDARQLVTDTCAKEREQTKALLARARQILDADESLRQRLQNLLSCEIVTKADYLAETQRIWQTIKPERASATAVSRAPSGTRSASHAASRTASPSVQPLSAQFPFGQSVRQRSESPSVQGPVISLRQFSRVSSPGRSERNSLPAGGPACDVSTSSLRSMSQISQRSSAQVSAAQYQPPPVMVPSVMSCASGSTASLTGTPDTVLMPVPPAGTLLRADSGM